MLNLLAIGPRSSEGHERKCEKLTTFDAAFVVSRTDDSVVKFTHGKGGAEVVQGEAETQ